MPDGNPFDHSGDIADDQNPFDHSHDDQVATQANPFDHSGETSSAAGAGLRGAERGLLPSVGAMAGAGAGAEAGSALGLLGGPLAEVTVPVGGLIGGIGGAYLGAEGVGKAQQWAMDKLPDSVKKAVGQDTAQQQADIAQHPIAEFAGEFAPQLATMSPGAIESAAGEGASAIQRIASHPVTARTFGAGLGAGQEAAQEETSGEDISPTKIAIAGGAGALLNKPTAFGHRVSEIGAAPVRTALGRNAPVVPPATDDTTPPPPNPGDEFPAQKPVEPTSPVPPMQAAKDAATPVTPKAAASQSIVEPRYDAETQTYGLADQAGNLLHTGYASAEEAGDAADAANASGVPPQAPEPEGETRESVHSDALKANIEPTDGQKAAGNYQKGHTSVQDMDIAVENPAGSVRSGVDAEGNPWEATMPADTHYGYLKGTEGADQDPVDAFVGPNPKSDKAFVVDQIDPETGEFDEHKTLLGFDTQEQALDAYRGSFSDGSADSRIGAVTPMSIPQLKEWIDHGDTTQPVTYGRPEPISEDTDTLKPVPPLDQPVEAPKFGPASKDIVQYLAKNGGLKDPGGDLQAMIGTKNKMVPFHGNLINRESGMNWDTALQKAVEGGYFPEEQDVGSAGVTAQGADRQNALMDAIDQTLHGKRYFTPEGEATESARAEYTEAVRQGRNYLDQNGYDHRKVPDKNVPALANQIESARRMQEAELAERFGDNEQQAHDAAESFHMPDDVFSLAQPGEPFTPVVSRDFTAELNKHLDDAKITDPYARTMAVRDILTKFGNQHGVEFAATMENGKVLHFGTSNHPTAVDLPRTTVRAMRDPNNKITLYHNHPMDYPLSRQDIAALVFPGLSNVVAHTARGEISSAEMTPAGVRRFGRNPDQSFDKVAGIHDAAYQAVAKATDRLKQNGMLPRDMSSVGLNEIAAQSLADIGLINYTSSRDLSSIPADSLAGLRRVAARAAWLAADSEGFHGRSMDDVRNTASERFPGSTRPDAEIARILAKNASGAEEGRADDAPAQGRTPDSGVAEDASAARRLNQPEDEKEPSLLDTPVASAEDLRTRQSARDREAIEAANKGRKVAKKPQADAEDLPLFGGDRQARLFQPDSDERAPVWYSALERGVEDKGPNRAAPAQWDALIRNMPGIKTEERDWSGIHDWLADQKGPVSKQDVLSHLRENGVQVSDVMKGGYSAAEWDARYAEAVENGDADAAHYAAEQSNALKNSGATKFDQYTLPGGENYRELLLTLPPREKTEATGPRGWHDSNPNSAAGDQNFRSGHWDEPNILAHVRFDDRVGPGGEKVLHVAEVQSDLHQTGKKRGYKTDEPSGQRNYQSFGQERGMTDQEIKDTWRSNDPRYLEWRNEQDEATQRDMREANAVPDMPFKTSWPDLAMKRMVRYAAENGYDRLSWDTGDVNADRYDLGEQVDNIKYYRHDDGTYDVSAYKDWKPIWSVGAEKLDAVESVLGKEIAKKIADGGQNGELSGLDLQVGGEGMRGFYDKTLPNIANKIGKPFGAKVESAETKFTQYSGSHYEGAEPTPEQIEAVWRMSNQSGPGEMNSPITGERQHFQLNRVDVSVPMTRLISEMRHGASFDDAMRIVDRDHGASEIANIFGGKIVPEHEEITAPSHSIPITPEMRAGAMQGMRLFQPKDGPLIPEAPTTIPEGRDYLDSVSDAIGEHLKSQPPGTYERDLKKMAPPEGPNKIKDLNIFERFSIFPRILASQDTMFGRMWNRLKERTNTQNGLMHDYRSLMPEFLKLSKKEQAHVYAAEELDRIWNNKRENNGDPVDWYNTSSKEAEFSKPGDKGTLTPNERTAYFERRQMFQRAWTDVMEGTARKFGWTGDWTGDAHTDINAIVKASQEANHPAARKQLQRTADLMVAMEAQRRQAYVPLMRFGDYYIAVKNKLGTEPDSPGGFPSMARFELVERPALADFLGGRSQSGDVPKYAQARIDELTKQYGADHDIEHGFLYKKPDVLRNLNIPAVEKLLMLMEGNVKQSLKEQAARRSDPIAPSTKAEMKDQAASDWDRMYSGLLDTFREQMYKEIKAGSKKQSKTIPGYSQDFGRVTGAYMHWASRHVSDLLHGDEIEHAYNDIMDSHPNESIRQYTKKWRDYQDDPQGPFSRVSQSAAQLGFAYTLAANPSSSFVIALHGPVVGHASMSVGVGGIRAGAALYGALGQMLPRIRADATRGLYLDHTTLGANPAERAYMASLNRDGLLHAAGADDIRALNDRQSSVWGVNKNFMRKAMDIASSNITVIDQMNRSATALGAFRLASDPATLAKMNKAWAANEVWRDMAQRDGVTPENMGRFMLSEAAFEYGKAAAAPAMRGAGQILFQLHGFQTRALSTMWKLTMNMGLPGKMAAAWIGAAIWATAGVEGLPFVQDIENLGDNIWKALTNKSVDPMITYRIRELLADSGFSKTGAELVMRGPIGQLLGVDLASRVGFGDPITREFSGTDMIGTVPSILYSRYQGMNARRKNNQSPLAVAAEAMPAGIRNPMMAAAQAEQGIKTRTGKTKESASKMTSGELARQAVGFRPTSTARTYEQGDFAYRANHAHGPVPKNEIPKPNE